MVSPPLKPARTLFLPPRPLAGRCCSRRPSSVRGRPAVGVASIRRVAVRIPRAGAQVRGRFGVVDNACAGPRVVAGVEVSPCVNHNPRSLENSHMRRPRAVFGAGEGDVGVSVHDSERAVTSLH
eukprot:3475270-Rhodomonas_salina.2